MDHSPAGLQKKVPYLTVSSPSEPVQPQIMEVLDVVDCFASY